MKPKGETFWPWEVGAKKIQKVQRCFCSSVDGGLLVQAVGGQREIRARGGEWPGSKSEGGTRRGREDAGAIE